jgi:hypothetical protein
VQLRVLPEVVFDLPALFFGEGTEGVCLLEVVEALAHWFLPWLASRVVSWIVKLVAHPGTATPRESKYSRTFFKAQPHATLDRCQRQVQKLRYLRVGVPGEVRELQHLQLLLRQPPQGLPDLLALGVAPGLAERFARL